MSDSTTPRTVAGIREHLRVRARAALAELGVPDAPLELAPPPSPELGDLGFPCFALAKQLRKAPPAIAREVAERIAPDTLIARVGVDKAYVNFTLDQRTLTAIVLEEILRERGRYGSGQAQPAQHVMVEYSSPNTNKPLHLGHLRNNVLGSSVAAILAHYGHRVTRINLVNDRGVHICKSMLAYRHWGEGTDPARAGKKGDHLVGDFYVLFDREFSEEHEAWLRGDPARAEIDKDRYFNTESALGGEVRELLRRWEEGDAETLELWRRMNGWVLAGFDASYARMGVRFDEIQYESETYKLGKAIVEQGLASGALERLPDGAVVCDLARVGLKGQKVLLRSDGTSVYMTQDLGTAAERFERFALDRLIYVVGDEQAYHFEVLFKVLGLLRPGLSEACHHLAYGMIRLPEGKMKSREGTVVDADDLMDEMHLLAREETLARVEEGKAHSVSSLCAAPGGAAQPLARGIDERELVHRAERIGLAALKYFLLKFTPRKSFEYNPRESIDFLGQTGPYCLFNYARTRSLLRKALASDGRGSSAAGPAAAEPLRGEDPRFEPAAAARLVSERERELVKLLAAFPEVVARAAQSLDPSRLAEHLFELARAFAFIFTDKSNHPIATCEDAELRHGRLMLVAAVGHALATGLGLLGIEPLEEM